MKDDKLVLVRQSLIASLFMQITIGMADIYALTWKIQPEGKIIRRLLIIELQVQTFEFFFYLLLTYIFFQKPTIFFKYAMTIRYIDWMITTPIMLFTLMVFLSGCQSLQEYWENHAVSTIVVILLDWMMLFFGFQNERTRECNPCCSDWIHHGFYPFFLMFGIIYNTFEKNILQSRRLQFFFGWFFFLWTLYGIAAFYPFAMRNTIYNILDIFSKNITGILLIYILWGYRS
jgi:bacteriorhodopsin